MPIFVTFLVIMLITLKTVLIGLLLCPKKLLMVVLRLKFVCFTVTKDFSIYFSVFF